MAENGRSSAGGGGRPVKALKPHDETNEPTDQMIASVVTQVNNAATGTATATSSATDGMSQPSTQPSTSSWMSSTWRRFVCCIGGERTDDEDETAYYASTAGVSAVELVDVCRWPEPVIGPPLPDDVGKKALILDLDETLVHSSFRPVPNPDFIIPVEIDGRLIDVYVLKRPYVDEFLQAVGPRFEVIVFTASLGKYADPLLDLLDQHRVIKWRLFREACYPWEGSYVKDLQCMGRDMKSMILVDNSPHSYAFQPENAVPIGTFIDDPADQELLECLDTLLAVEFAPDVRPSIAAELQRKDMEYFGFGGQFDDE